MTDIGELVVRIKADAAQLEQEMKRANGVVTQNAGAMEGAFKSLKAQILSLAPALSAVALVQFGRHAIEATGHIVDLSERIGFASTTLAALETPLSASGSNLDEFSAAVNRMNNILGEAAKGNEEAIKAFDGLGLSVRKLRALSPEDQFYAVAAALGKIKDQSQQTEAGMNIFGRGFSAMLPLLKQYEGDMRKAVGAQMELNSGLEKEKLDRIDAFGDALSAAGIKARNSFSEALYAILKVSDAINEVMVAPATNAKSGMPGQNPLPKSYIDKANKYGFVTSAKFITQGDEQYGPPMPDTSAKGSNANLLGKKAAEEQAKKYAEAKKSLDEYIVSLERQHQILQQTPREQAAMEVGYKLEDLSKKANIKLTAEQIEANENLARTNYDLAQSMQEAARFQQELHDKLSATLTDIAFKADSASESMLAFAESIAKAAFEKKVAGPLADALIGTGGSKGLLDSAIGGVGSLFGGFFADGGSPPVGIPSIVGENGPEVFVPKTAGTIIPNGAMGGQKVTVYQTFSLNPGATEQTVAQLRNLVPSIMAETKAAVFVELQRGGPGSKIAGLRN